MIAFAGIGNPTNFFDFLKENHLNLVKELSYPDHYSYSEKDLEDLNKLEEKFKAKLITTEKDHLRINSFVRKRFEYIKVEVLEDLPTFTGMDAKNYTLKNTEKEIIPMYNAKILSDAGKVKIITEVKA